MYNKFDIINKNNYTNPRKGDFYMLAVIVDKENSWLFNIADEPNIDLSTLDSQFSTRYIGWLVNTKGITQLVMQMPITRFSLKECDGTIREITREQAEVLYGLVEEFTTSKKNKGVSKK